MKWMQETTEWEDGLACNHIYLMDGSKAVAYIKAGTNEHKVFSRPMMLDLRGRKFNCIGELEVKPVARTKTVQGSKGETYTVDLDEHTCTCPGFKFRGTCKHIGVDKR